MKSWFVFWHYLAWQLFWLLFKKYWAIFPNHLVTLSVPPKMARASTVILSQAAVIGVFLIKNVNVNLYKVCRSFWQHYNTIMPPRNSILQLLPALASLGNVTKTEKILSCVGPPKVARANTVICHMSLSFSVTWKLIKMLPKFLDKVA